MPRRAAPLAILLVAAALVAPLALAEEHERHAALVSVLAYHPYPDPDAAAGLGGDPFGVEEYPRAPKDRMAGYYGAYWFPTVRVDGVLESSASPGEPARDTRELHALYDSLVRERLGEDAPLAVRVDGRVEAGRANVTATFTPTSVVESGRVAFRLVVFEDGVAFDGGNGVPVHDHTVRLNLAPHHASLRAADGSVTVAREFNVSADWDAARLGVVAFAQNEDPDARGWREKEVLQSATYRFAQDGPTLQERRAVLLEVYTATWCGPCKPGDEAVAALASTYGEGGPGLASDRWTYFRPPSPVQVAVALAGAALVAFLLWPRRERDG